MHPLSRRDLLQMGAAFPLVLGCGGPRAASAPDVVVCGPPTHDNIEGPYYRAGAPLRSVLVEPGMNGIPLVIEGRVTSADCRRGLLGAELDVWQADHAGHYDNDGSQRTDKMLLRGKLVTDGDGRFRVATIVPGRYLNGAQYRPAHVHVKVRAAGKRDLTTQLYFPDDPFNKVDPFIHPSLVMPITKKSSEWQARFDFVLRDV